VDSARLYVGSDLAPHPEHCGRAAVVAKAVASAESSLACSVSMAVLAWMRLIS
jgi:hypothetical protein